MKLSVLASLGLHALVIVGLVLGLPRLAPSRVELAQPVPVQVIDPADIPRTTQPEDAQPQAEAPEPAAVSEPEPEPEPKPEPDTEPEPPAAAPAPQANAAPPPPDKPAPAQEPPFAAPEPAGKPEVISAPAPKAKPAPPNPEPAPEPEEKAKPAPKPAAKPESKPEPSAPADQPIERPAETEDKAEAKSFDALALVVDLAARSQKRPPAGSQSESPAEPKAGQPSPLGEQVTGAEIAAVRQAVERHWTINAGAAAADDLVIDLRLRLTPDCMVKEVSVVDQKRYQQDPAFRAAADSAMRAVRLAQPLPLPMGKYDAWKTMTLRFDPSRML